MQKRNKRKSKNINFRRQIDIFDPKTFKEEITIAGCGNIGSQTALALVRLGIKNFTLFDPDKVEEHNLSSQSFFVDDIGNIKVNCIAKLLSNVNTSVKILVQNRKFNGSENLSEYLIIAVDSMLERKKIAKQLEKAIIKPTKIIDGRMGGPQLEIYTCDTAEEWKETFSDNPDKDPCTARYISYTSMIISALIANQLKRVIKKEIYKKEILFNIDTLQIL